MSISSNTSMADVDLFELSLEELLKVEVTGATLQPSTLKKVPAAVTVLTKEQIDLYGFTHLTSLLNYVSGYQVQRSDIGSFTDSISSRSLKANGVGREILTLVDGQRLNSDWAGGSTTLLSNFSLEHVKRIEVIKGSGSALYGSNAYAGVINIITEMTNEISVTIGSHEHKGLSGQFNHMLEEGNISGYLSAEDNKGAHETIYNPFTNSYEDTRSPYQAFSVYLKAQWQNIEVNLSHQKNESEQYYTLGFVSGDDNYLSMEHQFIRVKHEIDLNDKWHLKSQVFLSKHQQLLGGKIIHEPLKTIIKGQVTEQDKGIELALNYASSAEENILFGFEYRAPELTNTDAYTEGALNLYLPQSPTNKRIIKGAFIQYQNKFFDGLEYILGARQDDYSNFGSHLSPRIGINWELNSNQVVKFLYGNSFRAPSRVETDVMNSSAFIANPNLKPEIFSTYDAIWQYSSGVTHLSIDLFYNNVSDGIIPTESLPAMFTNEGSGSSSGIELDWLYRFDDQWQVRMNFMKLFNYDEEFYTDSDMAAGLIISYTSKYITYSLLANYQASMLDTNSSLIGYSKLPASTEVEAHANWAISDKLSIKLNISNLFDTEAYGTAYRSDIIGGVKERGINVSLELQWNF